LAENNTATTLADIHDKAPCILDCGCECTVRGRRGGDQNSPYVMVYIDKPCPEHKDGLNGKSVRKPGSLRQFKATQAIRHEVFTHLLKKSFGM
jgi:hypothetical protein